jgi:hypothetical protein
MRITADIKDPDFVGVENYGRYKVTIDGFTVSYPVEADDLAGYVITHEFDSNGRIVVDYEKGETKKKTLRGLVRIIDTPSTHETE